MRVTRFLLRTLPLFLAVGVILTVGCAAQESKTTQPPAIRDVTAQDAYTIIQQNRNNSDFVILDVRTPQEFAEGHIDGAINLDFYLPNFSDKIEKLDRGKTYLLHCRSGSRSLTTFEMMKRLNFTRIYHMTGGILEWQTDGLPVVKATSSSFGNQYLVFLFSLTQTNPALL
ncbi:MAG: hypothetical protein A2Z28_04840 [Chloroflexi bacterium RBG_16_51_9]|nr:MAG: hypothetical protein A2Z28_04840 [Chloroflexi bacterium RBG_16_51_9]